ncbi:MAG: metallophosphoesterase, partial [Eubacterium sp.]
MEIALIILIFIVALAVFLYLQNNIIDITKYRIKSGGVNGRVKIVQLSDLHSKPFKKVLKKLDEIKPDIIVITGDYINDKGKNLDKMIDFAGELVSRAPVYYITGNHERRLKNFDSIMQSLKNAGFNVLLDDIAQASVNGSNVFLLGLDENMADFSDYKARRNGTFEYR